MSTESDLFWKNKRRSDVRVYWLDADPAKEMQAVNVEIINGKEVVTHSRPYFIDSRSGAKITLAEAETGAMYDAIWLHKTEDVGADGLSLCVKLPNEQFWRIDSRASNCDSPCRECGRSYKEHFDQLNRDAEQKHPTVYTCTKNYKDAKKHKCWVRHGSIEEVKNATIHVDKDGATCKAGAGSIFSMQNSPMEWHGFLHRGRLVQC